MTVATIEPKTVATGMDVLEAITTRRSVGKVSHVCPPRAQIEQLLEAASWAPNHHLTEPWRFVVIAGEAREAFGDAMATAKIAGMDPTVKDVPLEYDRAKGKALRAPVIIAIGTDIPVGVKRVEIEEVAACAAAVQNLLLAAHALGLGAIWRTGDPAYDSDVKAFLGFAPTDHILGFVYVGYPIVEPTRSKHTPATELTRWLGWSDESH